MKSAACLTVILYLTLIFQPAAPAAASPLLKKYAEAVQDCAVAKPSEIVSNLLAVTPGNNNLTWNSDKTKVLVVTWKSQKSYDSNIAPYTLTSNNEAYVIWVTMAPYVQDFCRDYASAQRKLSKSALDLRLKERLGLHPDWQYDVFVELWVSPEDLFRPCVDPSPADSTCDLNFGNSVPQVKNIANYPNFYKNLYFNDMRAAPGVPWTGLGYTYDWKKSRRPEGESEFILSPSSAYEIRGAYPTMDYCRP